ncbi:hypothetical protein KDA_60810 [Dictyobacter alpinus]|uniref:Oxidoreductase n=1 Tax=Dictyobacter alpinus TaxID=2014873 RepID=A0A402BH71_9CHLR|nr:Gfo/Idh/MocA family oxidoreductase [Dictyobacter alpinus]GCE30597.1 hypothetical protein KDA_60810 [Dictyobacter alpinus]
MQQSGLGIVGYGGFGEFTAKAYAQMPEVKIVAVTDVNAARRNEAASIYQATAYETYEQLLADPAVDIVVINTPPWLHAAQAQQAALAGKHIFLEKPLATDLADADALMQILQEKQVRLSIDYVLRHVPIYTILQKLTASNLLGKITYMRLENVASNEALHADHWFWKRQYSGGIFIEHGVHFFDLCNQLSQSEPADISGHAHTAEDGRQDRVMAAVSYNNGILANFYHAFDRPAILEQTVLRVVMERGTAIVTGWIPDRLEIEGTLSSEHYAELSELLGVELNITTVPAPEGITGATAGEIVTAQVTREDRTADYSQAVIGGLSEFIRSIQDPAYQPQVSLQDSYASFRLAYRAQQSIDQGHNLAY